ncbi:unnamed protein product [Jaminaea pallidilutea]
MPRYIIGRVSDPLLGVFTGVLAYYLWETDIRNQHLRPEGRSLWDLVQRKIQGTPPPARVAIQAASENSKGQ